MQIIKKSIQDLVEEADVFYELSRKLSCASVVDIVAKKFIYTSINNSEPLFNVKNLQEVFYDWKEMGFSSVAGNILKTNYVVTQHEITTYFSDHNLELSTKKIDLLSKIFWQEVAAHFTLPPTHVYIHEPDTDSLFDFGIYWKFCYIYLNNNTKQGIVIAADASD